MRRCQVVSEPGAPQTHLGWQHALLLALCTFYPCHGYPSRAKFTGHFLMLGPSKVPLHSRVSCIGEGFFSPEERQSMRTCHFKNLCFERDPDPAMEGRPKAVFYASKEETRSTEEMSTWADTPRTMYGDKRPEWWLNRPEVRRETVPKSGTCTMLGSNREPALATMLMPRISFNIGHYINDILLPMFTAKDAFGMADKELFFFALGEGMPNPKGCANLRQTKAFSAGLLEMLKACVRLDHFMPPLIKATNPTPWRALVRGAMPLKGNSHLINGQVGRCRRVCIPDMVLGLSGLAGSCHFPDRWGRYNNSDHCDVGRSGMYRRYRGFIRSNMNLTPEPLPSPQPHQQKEKCKMRLNVLFTGRSSVMRVVEEVGRLNNKVQASALEAYTSLTGSPRDCVGLKHVSMQGLSIQEQVELLETIDLAFGLCGGATFFNSFFLPSGSNLISICSDNTTLDWTPLSNMGHLNYVRYVPAATSVGQVRGTLNLKVVHKRLLSKYVWEAVGSLVDSARERAWWPHTNS